MSSSIPTRRAFLRASSEKTTSTRLLPSTTWALVMMYPSGDMMTPVPRAVPEVSVARTPTTLGLTFS